MIGSLWQRWFHGIRKTRANPQWAHFVGDNWPQHIMSAEVTDDFHAKQGRSTGRWILHRDGQQLSVYLKRHYRLPWWCRLLATLWPARSWSPALQEADHLRWAKEHGFPVPDVIAVAEHIGPRCRLQSMLAVAELVGMLPLHQAIPLAAKRLSKAAFERWKRALITELARLSHELHRRRYFHKDLYLCHFYLPQSDIAVRASYDFRGRLHMIDLHRLGYHPWTWPHWRIKDLAQLLYSSEIDGVTPRDRVRFWRRYRNGGKRTWSLRWLETIILLKWKRYRQHNHKRKQRTKATELQTGREAA